MSLVERFTRDEASKYVWGVLLLAAIAALVLAVTGNGDAIRQAQRDGQARAVAIANRQIEPRLAGANLTSPTEIQQGLGESMDRLLLGDPRVSRVRIWTAAGELVFSTDRSDRIGSAAALNDELLHRAFRGRPVTLQDASDTGGAEDRERSLLRTYAQLGPSAIAEIDQTDAGTVADVRTQWFWYQVLAAGAVALLLLLSVLSLRDPIERINTGVPFASSSIPRGYSLIDDERLHAVQEVYRLASARVERLEEKLAESEEARRRLEGDIQRQLSGAAVKQPPAPAPVPAPAAAPAAQEVVQVPESEVVQAPLGDRWAAAGAGPLARALREAEPATAAPKRVKRAITSKARRAKAKPAAKTPAPKPAAKPAEPKPAEPRIAAPKPVEASPAPAPAARSIEVPAPAPTPARPPASAPAVTPTAAPAPAMRRAAASVPAPAPSAAPAPARSPDADDAKAHRDALETFIRLTESDRQPHETVEVDQGAVRAALARTAARKKPGGEKLKAHDAPPEEIYGGPPADRR